jgi:hypothetical protein
MDLDTVVDEFMQCVHPAGKHKPEEHVVRKINAIIGQAEKQKPWT